jgi:hypothetical protein
MTRPDSFTPDIFTNVHKGLRKALFDLVLALGRADPLPERSQPERSLAREVMRFVRHHGDNEDVLLLPLLATHAPALLARMEHAHGEIERDIAAFEALIDDAETTTLHHAAAHFTARYLDHMHFEEVELEPAIRAAVPVGELAAFGPASVARTPEHERPMMLRYVMPAIPRAMALAQLDKMPEALAAQLRAQLG